MKLKYINWLALIIIIGFNPRLKTPIKQSRKFDKTDNSSSNSYHEILTIYGYFSRAEVPLISPFSLSSSSFLLVSSSRALMSSIVIPCHLSVQQNSCLWKLVNNLFSVDWMKLSTLDWRPHHLNWIVTSL